MKNKFFIIIIFLVLVLSFSIFYFSDKEKITDKKNSINASSYAFSQIKKTCTLFYGSKKINIYKNTKIGFSFKYPKDVVVCERTFDYTGSAQARMEITLWNKEDFLSETPQKIPLPIIIDINNEYTNKLNTLMNVISKKDVIIDNKKIILEEKINKTCLKDCPVFLVYDFWDNKNHFIISEKKNSAYSIVGSISFAD